MRKGSYAKKARILRFPNVARVIFGLISLLTKANEQVRP